MAKTGRMNLLEDTKLEGRLKKLRMKTSRL